MDDFVDVEEEGRPDFPCPYCYEEYDLASLCLHLKDEHPSESRVTVSFFYSCFLKDCYVVILFFML